jgi:hypothetical protein
MLMFLIRPGGLLQRSIELSARLPVALDDVEASAADKRPAAMGAREIGQGLFDVQNGLNRIALAILGVEGMLFSS